MASTQDSVTAALQRFGDSDLSLGIVSPVALYDVWLSRAGLTANSILQFDEPRLADAVAQLDRLIAEPSRIVSPALWSMSEAEHHISEVRKLLSSRRRLAASALAARRGGGSPAGAVPGAAWSGLEERLGRIARFVDEAEARAAAGRATLVAEPGLEMLERRWEIVRKVLAKDVVATTVGGMLLIFLTLVLVIAMFVDQAVSEIVSNSFLIVLGYFFGHNLGSRGSDTPLRSNRR